MVKKQLIMEKALELFATQGFEATSIQQITEHCGISKGAFYLSFKSKDELIIALIDHFMMHYISEIDHVVKNVTNNQQLLYKFYYAIFDSFQKHSNFAKLFMKEQVQSINNHELIMKTRYYDKLSEKIILTMVERLYGETVEQTKYDLIYCIKGFMRIYSELFLFANVEMNLDLLSRSLVEKTNLLAKHMTEPYITKDFISMFEFKKEEEISKEQMIELLEQKIEELEESLDKESLIILKLHISEPQFSRAIIVGLIGNIQNNPHLKWISFLLRQYLKL